MISSSWVQILVDYVGRSFTQFIASVTVLDVHIDFVPQKPTKSLQEYEKS